MDDEVQARVDCQDGDDDDPALDEVDEQARRVAGEPAPCRNTLAR